jgi:integrase
MVDTFGHLRPSEVDAGLIRAFIEKKLSEGLASGTVRIMIALLSSLYTDLIEDKQAEHNPAKGLPRKTMRLIKPSHDPRTTPFIERLSDVNRIFQDLPEPLNIAYAIGVLAGLRTSEGAGVRWRSVDIQGRRIHVREQAGKKAGEDTVPLKDKESRVVPILDPLLPILTAWKLKTGGEGDARVVPPMRVDGKKLSKQSRGKYLQATLKKLGLDRPGLGWYEATRHTFASHWVISGGSIEKLKEMLGHYSVVVTERYAHLRPDLFSLGDLGTINLTLGTTPAPVAEIGQSLGRAPVSEKRKSK